MHHFRLDPTEKLDYNVKETGKLVSKRFGKRMSSVLAKRKSFSSSSSSSILLQGKEQKKKVKRTIVAWPLTLDGTAAFKNDYFEYIPNVLSKEETKSLMEELEANHTFTRDKVNVFGPKDIPRTQVLLSTKAGVRYRYAGSNLISEAWSDRLQSLCDRFSQQFGVPFNSALVNCYENGKEKVGRHADDEKDMEHDVIVTISLGATRLFRITGKASATDKKLQIHLQNGSIHIQHRGAQKDYKHEVAEQKSITGKRISITLRQLRTPPQNVASSLSSSSLQKRDAKEDDEEEEEEPDGDFYFEIEDPEFQSVKKIAKKWQKDYKIGDISGLKCDDGEALARRFEIYVETFHPLVAKSVKKDSTIYESVLMFLEDDDDEEEEEEEKEDKKEEE